MSHRYGPSLQPGAYTYGRGGLGIPAEMVPSTGLDAPAYFFDSLSLPADTGVEISARITRMPVLGTLTLVDDTGRYSYTGASDYLLYELRAWDVVVPTDIGYGPGIGRVDFVIGGAATLSGDAALDPADPAGVLSGGSPSVLSGAVDVAAAVAGGTLIGAVVSSLGGDVTLADVAPGGGLQGDVTFTADSRHRIGSSTIIGSARRIGPRNQ